MAQLARQAAPGRLARDSESESACSVTITHVTVTVHPGPGPAGSARGGFGPARRRARGPGAQGHGLMLSVRVQVSHGIMFSAWAAAGASFKSRQVQARGPARYLHRPCQAAGRGSVHWRQVTSESACRGHAVTAGSQSPGHPTAPGPGRATEFESESAGPGDRDEHRDWYLRAGDRDRASPRSPTVRRRVTVGRPDSDSGPPGRDRGPPGRVR